MSRIIKAAQVETVAQPQPEPRPEDLGASASLSDYLVDAARVLEVAEAQASRLMERARARAVELVEEVERRASERLEAARREAEEAGYQEGLRRGREEGLQQAQAVVDRLERLAEQLVRLREDLLRLHEEDVVKLALAVAEKVIGRVKEEDHELAVRTVRHLLNQVSGRGRSASGSTPMISPRWRPTRRRGSASSRGPGPWPSWATTGSLPGMPWWRRSSAPSTAGSKAGSVRWARP